MCFELLLLCLFVLFCFSPFGHAKKIVTLIVVSIILLLEFLWLWGQGKFDYFLVLQIMNFIFLRKQRQMPRLWNWKLVNCRRNWKKKMSSFRFQPLLLRRFQFHILYLIIIIIILFMVYEYLGRIQLFDLKIEMFPLFVLHDSLFFFVFCLLF